jgi:hypothetical protein
MLVSIDSREYLDQETTPLPSTRQNCIAVN